MARLLMIDNYDSFTYNLVQYLGELGAEVETLRNDAASAEALVAKRPQGVVISPGPGRPEDAGVSVAALRAFGAAGIPVLGVCLGHQALGLVAGGRIV
ncbi:MAG TPA: anthranilate/aminodeoxychorismate synthase component II, partial [Deltaproteobacteria bacterium]|nr:anthranilate/aminodeoxychorismate synthase component II [Deltaproteobacteria bacterium]